MQTEAWPRIFAYLTGSLMIGAGFYVFTHAWFEYVESPDVLGSLVLFAYGLAIFSLSYALAKRYTRKAVRYQGLSYALAAGIAFPSILQILLRDDVGVVRMQPVLFPFLLIASLGGAYFGMKKGRELLNALIQKALEKKQV